MRLVPRSILVLLVLFIACCPVVLADQPIPTNATAQTQAGKALAAALPIVFEPNVGQSSTTTKFIVHRPGLNAAFASDSVTLFLPQKGKASGRLAMRFRHRALIAGEQLLPGKTNYFRGNNPAAWHTGIANFGRIRYSQLWPGTDVLFYGNGDHLEHDFIVAPGANPANVSFELNGAQSIETSPAGDLLVHLADSLVTFKKPVAYQETRSGRREVAAAFKLNGNRVSFAVGRYDHRRPLTIDPVLAFSTYLAGSTSEEIQGLAVDAQNNIYVTGYTQSSDFPTTAGSLQTTCPDCPTSFDAFITKLDSTGTALVYSTFLGGTADDVSGAIAVDGNGNAVVAGFTKSADFPAVKAIGTASGAAGTSYLFVSSLSPTGAALNYSGIVGPLAPPFSFTSTLPLSNIFPVLALDSSANAYVATQTFFDTFPTTPSAIAPVPPTPPAPILVALKVGPTGSLLYSTAIPGRATTGTGNPAPNTFFQKTAAVDSTGSFYIAGQANDGLPTTLGVIGPAFASDSGFNVFFPQEGFLLKVNPAGSALTYATYVPATSQVVTMRLDSAGNIFLGGPTSSASLAISPNAFSTGTGCTGCQSGYLLKINNQATATLGGTYLHGAPPFDGSAGSAIVAGIALDSSGNIFASGTDSGTLPTVKPLLQPVENGFYIVQLTPDFSTLLFSSRGTGQLVEVAPSGKIILASENGYGFPTTPGAFQTAPPPGRTALTNFLGLPNIAAIDLTVAAPTLCLSPFGLDFGSGVTAPGTTSAPQSATVTNCGNADLHISSVVSDSPDFNVTTDCPLAPAGIAAGSSCKVTATYSPVDYKSGNAVIQDDAAGSPHKVGLFGFPKAPVVSFFPGLSLTFPETPVTISDTLGMQIFSGSIIATVSSMTTTGDFTVSQNCLGALPPPHPIPFPPGSVVTPCNFTVSFVPTNTGTRTGTLIVTDTALDSPQIIQLTGLGIAAWPTPIISSGASVSVTGAGANVSQSTGSPETLPVTGGGFSRVTTVTLDGLVFDNNVRQMTLVSPQQINLSLFDTDFGDVGEVPIQAKAPAPGGGTSNSVVTITSPIKFYDPTDRLNKLMPAGTIAVGPKSSLIYDSFFTSNFVSFTSPNIPVPSVGVLDPDREILLSGLIAFPDQSTAIAISDDETFMYAALANSNTVAQVALPGGTINFRASLGKDPALGNYNAAFIRVMPGHPHTWVASLQPTGDTKPIALKIFDDGVARTNTVEQGNASATFPGKLLFVGGDTTTVYSIDSTSLYRFAIDANGVTLKDKTAGLGAEDFATDGSLIYLSNGKIIDPNTLATTGTFALAPGLPMHAITVDATTHRAIFAGDATSPPGLSSLVQAFDTATLAAKGSLIMPRQSFVSSVQRWGSSGLVFGGSGLTVTRSSLTGNSGAVAPFHIGANFGQAPIPTAQISSGANAVFNLGIISTNGFNGPVTLSCSNLPQFASCSFSQNPVIPASFNNLGSGVFTVTINTHQSTTASAAPPRSYMRSGTGFVLLAGVLSLPFALAVASRRHRAKLLTLSLFIAIIGCGGGGGSTPTPTPPITPTPPSGQNTPIGTYDVILTGTSSQGKRQVVLQVIVLG